MTLPTRYGEHRPLYPGQTCEVCAAVDRLVVDHCHAHGWVRGTLCMRCNTRMAFVDRMITPRAETTTLAALAAHVARCPDCTAVTVGQLGVTRSMRVMTEVEPTEVDAVWAALIGERDADDMKWWDHLATRLLQLTAVSVRIADEMATLAERWHRVDGDSFATIAVRIGLSRARAQQLVERGRLVLTLRRPT